MRHLKSGVKLNRTTSHRTAMFRNMVTSLFKYDRIRTTNAKARELRRWADAMVGLAKRGDLHARRQALAVIREEPVVYKLFAEAQDRYGSIPGGYTRIVKIGRRPGDAAQFSLIELVAPEKGVKLEPRLKPPKKPYKKKGKDAAKAAKAKASPGASKTSPDSEPAKPASAAVE